LRQNPALLDRLAFVLGAAPALADHVARSAAALDALLSGTLAGGFDTAAALPALVKDARFLEEALDATRRVVTERRFEIDAAALEGGLDVDAAGAARSALADAAIAALLPRIAADFAQRHGKVAGGALGVVALGKLGARDMLPGSDLDLILVYDHAEDAQESRGGGKALPPSQYFGRLANQVVAALTSPGPEGKLYEVDMRLRPSGSKGPVAVSLPGFAQYHAESAWTWERMALTRARFVAGPAGLKRKVEAAIRAAQTRAADPVAVLADATAMRARMLRDLPAEGPWDVKLMRGGLVEAEFVAQALLVAHAHRAPAVLSPTTRVALGALGKAGLLPAEEVATLVAADRLWRGVLAQLRLTVGRWREEALPEPVAAAVLRAVAPLVPGGVVDQSGLRAQMREVAEQVRAIFARRIGPLDPG
ncbi:[protein-PII] uridylyltransferase family protein, partial [Falsiroseomonas oryzae]